MHEIMDVEEEARECGFELFSIELGKSVFARRAMGFGEDGDDRVEFAVYNAPTARPCWHGYAEHIDRNGDMWFKSGIDHGDDCDTVGRKLVGNRKHNPLRRGDRITASSESTEQEEASPTWTHKDELALQAMLESKKKFVEHEKSLLADFFVDVADEPLDSVIAFMKENADRVCELLGPYREASRAN